MEAGRPPAREALDGALIIVGGALLLTPGFISDVGGLLLLLPPTRALIRRLLVRRLTRRMVGSVRRDYDVEGRAVDVDQERLGR
jgi:UPF0716 protein FxsA